MDPYELLTLVDRVEFRLEMGKAVGSEAPLPKRVLRLLVKNADFAQLYEFARTASPSSTPPSAAAVESKTPDATASNKTPLSRALSPHQKIYQVLATDHRVKFLILECIEKYNQQLSVLAGLRSYLETTLSKLWKEKVGDKDGKADGESSIPLFFAKRRPNPLLQFALATLFGASTLGASIIVYKNLQKTPAPVDVNENEREKNRLKQIKDIIDLLDKLTPKEIKITDARCSVCPTPPSAPNGTLSLQFQGKPPDLKLITEGPLISVFPPHQPETPQTRFFPLAPTETPADYNINLHLSGLPSPAQFPPTLTLKTSQTPNYRVESLPASSADRASLVSNRSAGAAELRKTSQNSSAPSAPITQRPLTERVVGPYEIKLVLPYSYETATTCNLTLWIGKSKHLLIGDVKECSGNKIPPQISSHFELSLPDDSDWHFVPEIGAMARIEQHRTGFLWLGSKRYNISLQAVPFSKPETLSLADSGSAQGKSQGKGIQNSDANSRTGAGADH